MMQSNGVVPQTMDQQQAHQYQHQQQWMMRPPQPMWNQQPPPQQMLQQHQQPQAPPQQQQQQQQYASAQPASSDEIRTLWIGDLQFWMEENYIYQCFAQTTELVSVKLIRNKQTGQLEGYGFLEFANRAAAERVLQSHNGALMPNVEQTFRLNWASFGVGEKRPDDTPDFTIFIGDLASDVTDYVLQETFRAHYTSVKGAKVVTDRLTGRTKGYGFVRFGDENEQKRAMTEMNGMLCSTRPMRIGEATTKKAVGGQQYPKASYQGTQGVPNENDPNNTTIFVGGLDPSVTDDLLRQVFGQYGELVHVKIPLGKRCGFVQFADRSCAEEALRMLDQTQLAGQNIRLSWGRSPANKQDSSAGVAQAQPEANQWNNNAAAYYGYGPGYENYGYAPAPQNYYGSYPGYGNYQQQPQQQPQQ